MVSPAQAGEPSINLSGQTSLAPDGFEGMSVVKGSPAEAVGILVGDVTTAIPGKEGKSLHLISLDENLISQGANAPVDLILLTKLGTKTVELVPSDLH